MEGGGRVVGSLDDGHAFELDYWYCVSFDQRSRCVFSDLRLRTHRWEFGVGGVCPEIEILYDAQGLCRALRGPATSSALDLPFPLHRLRPQASGLKASRCTL